MQEEKKVFTIFDHFEKGMFIDAKDTMSEWRTATVTNVITEKNRIAINYDGWSTKYDDEIHFKNPKIAPYRRFTIGYTGQRNHAIRYMKFDDEQCEEAYQYMHEILKKNFEGYNSLDITQILRGKIYRYVDFILTENHQIIREMQSENEANSINSDNNESIENLYDMEKINKSIDIIKLYIQIVVKYLDILPSLFTEFNLGELNEDLYLGNDKIALSLCYKNLVEILQAIFGDSKRMRNFYQRNFKAIMSLDKQRICSSEQFCPVLWDSQNDENENANIFNQDINNNINQQQVSASTIKFSISSQFINYFGELGGFEKLCNLIQIKEDNLVPLSVLSISFYLFSSTQDKVKEEIRCQFIENMVVILKQRFDLIGMKELKDLDRSVVSELFYSGERVYSKQNIENNKQKWYQLEEELDIQLSLKCLQSGIHDKKLKGINEIQHMIDRVQYDDNCQSQNMYQNANMMQTSQESVKPCQYFQEDNLADWIVDNKVIQFIIKECNIEVLKRSKGLFIYLSRFNKLSLDIIDLIFAEIRDKHEATVRAINELIIDITYDMPKNIIDKIYSYIQQVDLKSYNQLNFELLKGFSEKANQKVFVDNKGQNSQYSSKNNSNQNSQQYNQEQMEEEFEEIEDNEEFIHKFYGLEESWTLMSYQFQNAELQKSANQNILSLFKQSFISQIKVSLVKRCLLRLQEGKNLLQVSSLLVILMNLHFSTQLISHHNPYNYMNNQRNIQEYIQIFKKLDEEFHIINIIVQQIQNHQNDNYQLLLQQKLEMIQFKKIEKGLFTLLDNFLKRFRKLQLSDIELTNQHILSIWQAYKDQPHNIFQGVLDWMCVRSQQQQYQESSGDNRDRTLNLKTNVNFSDELCEYLFQDILCNDNNMNFSNIHLPKFECFLVYFKYMNQDNQNIQIRRGKLTVLTYEYDGKQALWDMYLKCQDKLVNSKIAQLLCNMIVKGVDMNQERKISEYTQFIESCMKLLQQGSEQREFNKIEKGTQLLDLFIDYYEGNIKFKPSDLPSSLVNSNFNHQVTVNTQLENNQNKRIDLKINMIHPLGVLRQKIAKAYQIPVKMVRMIHKQNELDSDDDEISFKDNNFPNQILVCKKPYIEEYEKLHPKHIISSNQQWFDILLRILSIEGVSHETSNFIWEILTKLPTNQTLSQQILNPQQSWDQILNGSFHRVLYCLIIIEEFTFRQKNMQQQLLQQQQKQQQLQNSNQMDEENENNNQEDNNYNQNNDMQMKLNWRQQFIETKGLQYLLKIFLEFNSIEDALSKKFINKLLKLISIYLVQGQNFDKNQIDSIFKNQEFRVQIFEKILNTMQLLINYALQRERNDLENTSYELQQVQEENQLQQDDNYTQNCPKFMVVEEEIMQQLDNLIRKLGDLFGGTQFSDKLGEIIQSSTYMDQMLTTGLVEIDNDLLKGKFSDCLLNIISKNDAVLKVITKKLVTAVLNSAIKQKKNRADNYFVLIQNIIIKIPQQRLQLTNIQFKLFAQNLVQILNRRSTIETSVKIYDDVLNGILKVLRAICESFQEVKHEIGQNQNFVSQLLSEYLFTIPTKSNPVGPKCNHFKTRCSAFQLISSLCSDDNYNLKETLEYVSQFHESSEWRSKRLTDWNIQLKQNDKSSCGYVGLKNLGCICYMNSLLQQLYMIPSFRKSLIQCVDPQFQEIPQEDNILYQLKCMFLALSESEKQSYNPKGFCHSFKDFDGEPTNVWEQMDAEEFFNMLMDRLENQVKGAKNNTNFLFSHFGGILSNEIICKGCPHYSERQEPFMAVSLQVENKKDIQSSLQTMIDGEILDNDNAYYCEACDKKVSALKRISLKKLPNHLIMVLKRFKFDFDTMQKVKINDICEFPMEIDLEEYTQQGLNKKEGKENKDTNQKEYPPSYFKYKLRGIVIHMGIADSGHYYSYISDRDIQNIQKQQQQQQNNMEGENQQQQQEDEEEEEEKWYEFNDTIVRPFDPKDIPNEAFGGEEKWKYFNTMYDNNVNSSFKEKIRNAYLLFYDRVDPYEEEQDNDEKQQSEQQMEPPSTDASQLGGDKIEEEDTQIDEKNLQVGPYLIDRYCRDFKQDLLEENKKFHTTKFVFNFMYNNFVQNLLENHFKSNNQNNNPLLQNNSTKIIKNEDWLQYPYVYPPQNIQKYTDLELIKFSIKFFLTCIVRQKNKSSLPNFLLNLQNQLQNNIPACQWLLMVFSDKNIIIELIHDNSQYLMRRLIISLLNTALQIIYKHETRILKLDFNSVDQNGNPNSIMANFINTCIITIFSSKEQNRSYTDFFILFKKIIALGEQAIQYLLSKKIIGRFLEFVSEPVLKKQLLQYQQQIQFQQQNLGNGTPDCSMIYRDFQDLPVVQQQFNLMGKPALEKKKKILEIMEQKKKEKQAGFYNNSPLSKMYLWDSLAQLLSYCQVNEDLNVSQNVQKAQFILSDTEKKTIDQITLQVDKISKLLDGGMNGECKDKMSIRGIAFFLSYISFENKDVSENVIKAISKGVEEKQSIEYRPYFVILKYLANIQDSLTEWRIETGMNSMLNAIRENLKYYQECVVSLQLFVRIIKNNKLLQQWTLNNKEQWKGCVQWIQDQTTKQVTQSHQVDNKFQNDKIHLAHQGIYWPRTTRSSQNSAKIMINNLNTYFKGQFTEPDMHDPDLDLGSMNQNIHVGMKVDNFNFSVLKYVTGEIVQILDDLVRVQVKAEDIQTNSQYNQQDNEEWFPIDDEKLHVHKAMQENILFEPQQQQQQQQQNRLNIYNGIQTVNLQDVQQQDNYNIQTADQVPVDMDMDQAPDDNDLTNSLLVSQHSNQSQASDQASDQAIIYNENDIGDNENEQDTSDISAQQQQGS